MGYVHAIRPSLDLSRQPEASLVVDLSYKCQPLPGAATARMLPASTGLAAVYWF